MTENDDVCMLGEAYFRGILQSDFILMGAFVYGVAMNWPHHFLPEPLQIIPPIHL
jgi:hypothetical protein